MPCLVESPPTEPARKAPKRLEKPSLLLFWTEWNRSRRHRSKRLVSLEQSFPTGYPCPERRGPLPLDRRYQYLAECIPRQPLGTWRPNRRIDNPRHRPTFWLPCSFLLRLGRR